MGIVFPYDHNDILWVYSLLFSNQRLKTKMEVDVNSTELELAQHAQLIIAREIKRICIKNHINYSLAFGTLIGAIRHKGFIPWDDDLDIAMPREDYNRFIQCCAADLAPDFFLQTMDTDAQYSWPFLKVRLKGTHFRQYSGDGRRLGRCLSCRKSS